MKMILRVYDLSLKHRFTISRQSFDTKKTLIVELKDGNLSGYGEASENPYYQKTMDVMVQDLLNCKEAVELDLDENPEEFWKRLHPFSVMICLPYVPLIWPITIFMRAKRVKNYMNYGIMTSETIPCLNYTIGIDSIEKMIHENVRNSLADL